MTTPLPPDVKTLFRAPFRTDRQIVGKDWPSGRRSLRLYDGNMDTVSTVSIHTGDPVPRGYGRSQYLPNGDARHDAWCAWFTANVPERATLEDVARILNEAWAAP